MLTPRGLYRTNPTWIHPPEAIPNDSWRDDATGAMRSHMHYDQQKDLWHCELKVPRHMSPVLLGFVLWYPGVLFGFVGCTAKDVSDPNAVQFVLSWTLLVAMQELPMHVVEPVSRLCW